MFSLNFSSKFESYNLQHWKKNCHKLLRISRTTTALQIFLGGYITLAKKFHKPLLKKAKQRLLNKKDFLKNLFKVNEKKTRAF